MTTVVMYHYVRDLFNSRYPLIKGLDISQFVAQIRFLIQHYKFIRIEDLIESLYVGKALPSNAVLLTFDDAYIDHYTNVFPVLDYYNIQGCFYAPVKAITDHEVLDVNKIHFILASTSTDKIIKKIKDLFYEYRYNNRLKPFEYYYEMLAKPSRFDTKDVIFIKRLLQHGLDEKIRSEFTDILFKKFIGIKESAFSRELYMNEQQLKVLLRNGMHIGGHGHDHYWMDKLSVEKQKKEVELTTSFLDFIGVNKAYYSYCYPFGAFNDITVNILKAENYKCAFTTIVDKIKKTTNPFLIPRLDTNDLEIQ